MPSGFRPAYDVLGCCMLSGSGGGLESGFYRVRTNGDIGIMPAAGSTYLDKLNMARFDTCYVAAT